MNNVQLMGRLTADPEIRQTQNGTKVASYTLAVDRGGENGADFIRCTAFKQRADFAERYLHKGIKIAVCGSIHTDSYTDRDGRKVYTTEVWVNEHDFCESRQNAQNGPVMARNDTGQANTRQQAGEGFISPTNGFDGPPFN